MVEAKFKQSQIWNLLLKAAQQQTRRSIKHSLQIWSLKKYVIYLVAPLFLSRAPTKDFKHILEKLEAKFMGWRSKTLSWPGRGTLINFVIQVIPNYTISFFSLPAKTCDKMDALTCKFWWKPNDLEGKFLTLLELNNLCKPKCKDGLGFEKSKDINNALLAKFAWMIAFKRDSLCMLILRAKYKVKQD